MPFDTTYRQGKERIGRLNERLTFFAPVSTRTSTGGQRVQWLEWRETRGMVDNTNRISGNEQVEADRRTAINTKRFTVRSGSIPNVNETMMLVHAGQQYRIERLDILQDTPRGMYTEVVATRRDTQIQPVDFLANQLYMDWSQNLTNQTGTYATITAGTLLSATTNTAALINQRLFVFRGGLRLVYGEAGDGGFTIVNATNRIVPNMPLAGENLLVHQYGVAA